MGTKYDSPGTLCTQETAAYGQICQYDAIIVEWNMPTVSSPKVGICSDNNRGNPVTARIRYHYTMWCLPAARSKI